MTGVVVSAALGLHLRAGQERRVPTDPGAPQPSPKPPPSDLVALVHFVVDELQQEPHDISQDKGGDEVPVDRSCFQLSHCGLSTTWGPCP